MQNSSSMNLAVKVTCDQNTGVITVVYFQLRSQAIDHTDEFEFNKVFAHYNAANELVGIEVKSKPNPKAFDLITQDRAILRFVRDSIPRCWAWDLAVDAWRLA